MVLHLEGSRKGWRMRTFYTKLAYWSVLGVMYVPWPGVDSILLHYITLEERQAFVAILLYLCYQALVDICHLSYMAVTASTAFYHGNRWQQTRQPYDNLFDVTLCTMLLCLCTVYNTLDNSYTSGLVAVWVVKVFYKLHLVPHQANVLLCVDLLVDLFACTALLFGGVLVSFDNNVHVFFMYILQTMSLSLVLTSTFLKF